MSVVQNVKYGPVGDRGYAPTHRVAIYGFMDSVKYASAANENTLKVYCCETVKAMNNVESILFIDDMDVVFTGSFNLGQSIGVTG